MTFHPITNFDNSTTVFNNPFYYQPSKWSKIILNNIFEYLAANNKLQYFECSGKMFGILIVQNSNFEYGFLAAFSGQCQCLDNDSYFVPPIFNYVEPNGYFKIHEAEISAINKKISDLENNADYQKLLQLLVIVANDNKQKISNYQQFINTEKEKRKQLRSTSTLLPQQENQLIKQSQFQKAELKRLKKKLDAKLSEIDFKIKEYQSKIDQLKQLRESKSQQLQTWLFKNFEVINIKKEPKSVLEIFAENGKFPPSGSGECCAPKLLHYAFKNNFKPIEIAEFWIGASAIGEIRINKNFYPACQSKCKPILNYMLQGINYAENQLHINLANQTFNIIYQDDFYLVINKPAGMLSVPGNSNRISVYDISNNMFGSQNQIYMVHRLDMATSGLMIIAKSKLAYDYLKIQFENHTVDKMYYAVLNGVVNNISGTINLPLMPDFNDLPRQKVDFEFGKNAITYYKVDKILNSKTFIKLFPKTGRTHQLRIHCAYKDGLNCPILGDELYGIKADRMYLHAQKISFYHNFYNKKLTFEALPNFNL